MDHLALGVKARSEVPGIELLKSLLKGTFLDIDSELQDIHSKRLSQLQAEFRGESDRSRSFLSMNFQGEVEGRDPANNGRGGIESYQRAISKQRFHLARRMISRLWFNLGRSGRAS